MIGIYDTPDKRYTLLEICSEKQLPKALADWKQLGFTAYLGPAYKNLIILYNTQ